MLIITEKRVIKNVLNCEILVIIIKNQKIMYPSILILTHTIHDKNKMEIKIIRNKLFLQIWLYT